MVIMQVFVVEPQPRWGPELKRQFLNRTDVRIRELSRLAEAAGHVPQPDLIVLDAAVGAAEAARFLVARTTEQAAVPVVYVESPEADRLEWVLREMGAVSIQPHRVTGDELARLISRLLQTSQPHQQ